MENPEPNSANEHTLNYSGPQTRSSDTKPARFAILLLHLGLFVLQFPWMMIFGFYLLDTRSLKPVNFWHDSLWDLVNTLFTIFAVVTGLMSFHSGIKRRAVFAIVTCTLTTTASGFILMLFAKDWYETIWLRPFPIWPPF